MKITSCSNLAASLDGVTADHEPIIMTRERQKPAAVLISLNHIAGLEQTLYLLKTPRSSAERLPDAAEAFESGRGNERTPLVGFPRAEFRCCYDCFQKIQLPP